MNDFITEIDQYAQERGWDREMETTHLRKYTRGQDTLRVLFMNSGTVREIRYNDRYLSPSFMSAKRLLT